MVLTAAQTTAFFENPDQMGIPHKKHGADAMRGNSNGCRSYRF